MSTRGAHHAPKSSRKELILSAPPIPIPPAGAPSSAPSPGSAAAATPLRIDTKESWNRANAWLDSDASSASPVAGKVKRLLDLAENVMKTQKFQVQQFLSQMI